jgi:hypothetical protein
VLDSGDEEDDSMERAGCGYHTVEQKQVGTSRIVKPPEVRAQSRRRAPTRQGQDFEDQTCDLLRKAEEETVLSRLALEYGPSAAAETLSVKMGHGGTNG